MGNRRDDRLDRSCPLARSRRRRATGRRLFVVGQQRFGEFPGIDLHDLAQFSEAFARTGHPEMDFDGSGGTIGLGDFMLLARAFVSGSNGSYCP